jgi:hypothetical protein
MTTTCLFCGGDLGEDNHWQHCDGRQGAVEARWERGPVLNRIAACAERDIALARVEAHATESFSEAARAAVHHLALTRSRFCVDDVWASRESWPETPDRRALGTVMQRAAREQWIVPTAEFVNTAQRARHAAPVRIWQSLIVGPVPA